MAIFLHFKMKMRSRGNTGVTHFSNNIALRNLLSLLHQGFKAVGIYNLIFTNCDPYKLSIVFIFSYFFDGTSCRRFDRSTDIRGYIYSVCIDLVLNIGCIRSPKAEVIVPSIGIIKVMLELSSSIPKVFLVFGIIVFIFLKVSIAVFKLIFQFTTSLTLFEYVIS